MVDQWGAYQSGGYSQWCAGVSAWVTSETDTTATVHVEARWWSKYAFQVANGNSAYTWCDGQNSGWQAAGGISSPNNSSGTTRTMRSQDFVVQKHDSARNIRVAAGVRMAGGYANGTSEAAAYLTIGGIRYKKPNPPKNVAVSRINDSSLNTTWQSNYDNAALKIWRQIIIDLKSDVPGKSGSWQNKATLNWDATNYKITGLASNSRYYVAMYARNPSGDSDHVNLGYYYTTPSAPNNVTATKTGNSSARVSVDTSNLYAHKIQIYRSINNNEGQIVATVDTTPDAGSVQWDDTNVPGGTIAYKAYAQTYVYGTSGTLLRSAGTAGNTITTIQVPNAPTITAPSDTNTREVNSSVKIEWRINHPDGTAQRDAKVEITYPNSTQSVKYVSGATNTYTITGLTVGMYKVRVQTRGLHSNYGAWSEYKTIRVAARPVVQISSPTSGQTLRNLPLNIAWSVADSTGVSQQRVTITDDGRTIYNEVQPSGARQLVLQSEQITPDNNSTLLVTVWVRGGSGLESQTSTSINVRYEPPAQPSADVSYDTGRLTPTITVTFNRVQPADNLPEYFTFRDSDGSSVLANFYTVRDDDGSTVAVPLSAGVWKPKTVYATVHRVNADGSLTLIADRLSDGYQVEDVLAPLNVQVSYRVTAYAASGASASTDVSACVDADVSTLNFGADGSVIMRLPYNQKISRKVSRGVVEYDFADGQPYVSVYPSGTTSHDTSISGNYPYSQELYHQLLDYAERYYVAWHREASGVVERVQVEQSVSYDWTKKHMILDYSASLRRVPLVEPER